MTYFLHLLLIGVQCSQHTRFHRQQRQSNCKCGVRFHSTVYHASGVPLLRGNSRPWGRLVFNESRWLFYQFHCSDRISLFLAELPIVHKSGVTTPNFLDAVHDTKLALSRLEYRISCNKNIPIEMLRNVLRRAAALLCSSDEAQPSIISHLVNIPFDMFTRESIKMGISLWLGVIHENPRTEPRILTDVTQAWERTIFRKLGIFDVKFKWDDSLAFNYTNNLIGI